MSSVIHEGAQRAPFMALDRQHSELSGELHAAFERVLSSSAFVLGEEVERFEREFADYCGVEHCVGVSSGTAALTLALRAVAIGPGDEVIVPAHTFIASALAVAYTGATPVLADVDPGSGLIDPDAARALVGPRTAAVVAVHLYGQPADVDAIRRFADPNGLMVLEDAAQAHGATLGAHRVGSLGTAAGFSFYPSKNLGALGDGGAVCTDDRQLAERVRRLRNLGQRAKGEHLVFGWNERLDGIQAALLGAKLPHLDGWNETRRLIAAQYRRELPDWAAPLDERPDTRCVYHLFPIRVRARDALRGALAELGVETGIHYHPAVHRHRAWEGRGIRFADLTAAERWAAEELSLPIHPHMSSGEVERVIDALATAGAGVGLSKTRM